MTMLQLLNTLALFKQDPECNVAYLYLADGNHKRIGITKDTDYHIDHQANLIAITFDANYRHGATYKAIIPGESIVWIEFAQSNMEPAD